VAQVGGRSATIPNRSARGNDAIASGKDARRTALLLGRAGASVVSDAPKWLPGNSRNRLFLESIAGIKLVPELASELAPELNLN
jgi:hypothetical protein